MCPSSTVLWTGSPDDTRANRPRSSLSASGVSEASVIDATKGYGPFPRPSQQLGRTTVSDEQHRERVKAWVEQRRRGGDESPEEVVDACGPA